MNGDGHCEREKEKKVTANASNFLNQNEILDPGVIERINGKRANRKSFMGQSSNKQEGRVVLVGSTGDGSAKWLRYSETLRLFKLFLSTERVVCRLRSCTNLRGFIAAVKTKESTTTTIVARNFFTLRFFS